MRDGDFLVRSTEISRIEGLSDAVFGFAITLLIVSLEVPRTAVDVLHALRGFGSFAITFAILFMIWRNQFKFFRRYGLEDDKTVWLTAVLLFTVLLFVYPLKFFFGTFVERVLSRAGYPDSAINSSFNQPGMRQLMLIYGLGWCAVFVVFHLMYRHAYSKRDELKLNAVELFDTTEAIATTQFAAGCGLVVAVTTFLEMSFPQQENVLAYASLGAMLLLLGNVIRRRRTRNARREAAAA